MADVSDLPRVPIVFFDGLGTFRNTEGIVYLSLLAGLTHPTNEGGVTTEIYEAAHLRCSVRTAQQLIDALSKAILAGAQVQGGTQ